MPELVVVRHAQAAFGTDDYDRLTDLGHRQARWLGEYFAGRALRFDRVLTGTLRRHRETLDGIAAALPGLPVAETRPGLDEYDGEALLAAHLAARALPPIDRNADRRAHFRLLREVLCAWVDGTLEAAGHRSFEAFRAGARDALAAACAAGADRVLMVSSGGPISALVGEVLGIAPRMVVELNLQARNTGVSELRAGSRRVHLVSYNAVPHLEAAARRAAITYA